MTEYIVYYKLPSGGYRVCFSKTLEVHACDRLPEKFSNKSVALELVPVASMINDCVPF